MGLRAKFFEQLLWVFLVVEANRAFFDEIDFLLILRLDLVLKIDYLVGRILFSRHDISQPLLYGAEFFLENRVDWEELQVFGCQELFLEILTQLLEYLFLLLDGDVIILQVTIGQELENLLSQLIAGFILFHISSHQLHFSPELFILLVHIFLEFIRWRKLIVISEKRRD